MWILHVKGAHVRELATQARNVTVPDDFDLGDEVGKTGLDVQVLAETPIVAPFLFV